LNAGTALASRVQIRNVADRLSFQLGNVHVRHVRATVPLGGPRNKRRHHQVAGGSVITIVVVVTVRAVVESKQQPRFFVRRFASFKFASDTPPPAFAAASAFGAFVDRRPLPIFLFGQDTEAGAPSSSPSASRFVACAAGSLLTDLLLSPGSTLSTTTTTTFRRTSYGAAQQQRPSPVEEKRRLMSIQRGLFEMPVLDIPQRYLVAQPVANERLLVPAEPHRPDGFEVFFHP
jgi:hypothetical protein